MFMEELPQDAVFLGDPAGCELYLGRGLYALQLTRAKTLLELGEVFPPPSTRSPLVVADTCEIGLMLDCYRQRVGHCSIHTFFLWRQKERGKEGIWESSRAVCKEDEVWFVGV